MFRPRYACASTVRQINNPAKIVNAFSYVEFNLVSFVSSKTKRKREPLFLFSE